MSCGIAALAGCTGDEPGPDEAPAEDDDQPAEDDDRPAEEHEKRLVTSEDFDSYVLESVTTIEDPDGDVTEFEQMVRWDPINERYHVQMYMGEAGDGATFDFYRIGESSYQVMPDGSCEEGEGEGTLEIYAEQANRQAGGFRIPTEEDLDENLEYVGTQTVDGVEAHTWVVDLGETIEYSDGEVQVFVATETNYLLGMSGWYPIGAGDEQGELSFDLRYHSFDEELDIEVPEECNP